MKKVLITPRSFRQAGDFTFKLLEENGFEVIENTTGKTLTEKKMIELCSDVDGLLVGIDPVTERVMRNAPKLRAISKYGAGLDNIDLDAAQKYNIKVDRAAGTNAVSVAELAVGLFFTLARNIVPVSMSTKQGRWDRFRGVEITGKTVGIIGLGNIGREVARMTYGLGMEILACDPFVDPESDFIKKYNIKMTGLDELFPQADFLTLHLPFTDETRHMINAEVLNSMKNTAYIVNTSRGELVDEDALYKSLTGGAIAGAASDVFSKEPPGDHPLVKLNNFVLTSHIGAYTKEANIKMARVSIENLIRMLK
ncbi:MAG: phosphoglycerate dehydrogenase [Clostridiaceae bacterium]|nr:phosphoglycerate dehydrogenase [Clostridiaceae bacterium]